MRIIVTGGAGFIGSHLADALLTRGHQVAVLDDLSSGSRSNLSPNVEFFETDVRNSDQVLTVFESFQPDAVSHQAAQMSVSRSVREPGFDAEVNIVGLINVCAAAVRTGGRRVVFASSGGVLYGNVSSPAPEETPANPVSPYGISKWAGEKYLQFFQRDQGLSAIALRYANVYGERQNPHGEAGVVAIFCTRLLNGESATINGDGKYLRDYVHVSDVVQANVLALESQTSGFEAMNVGTGRGTDVNELAAALRHHCQNELRRRGLTEPLPEFLHGPERAGDLRSNLVDSRKAAKLLNWTPQVRLDRGLEQTAAWFAEKLLNHPARPSS